MKSTNFFVSPKSTMNVSHTSPMKPNRSSVQNNQPSFMLNTSRYQNQQSPIGFGNISRCSPIQDPYNNRRFSSNLTSAAKQQQLSGAGVKSSLATHSKQPKENVFFVETVHFHCNTGSGQKVNTDGRKTSSRLGNTFAKLTGTGSTAFNTTHQFSQSHTPNPEPLNVFNTNRLSTTQRYNSKYGATNQSNILNQSNYQSRGIQDESRQNFSKDVLKLENQIQDKARTSMGILKEQQYSRGIQDQPVLKKGVKNQHYQSPSLTSNEIFYVDYKGQPKPNIFRSASTQNSPEKQIRRASISSAQSVQQVEMRTQFMLQLDGDKGQNNFAKKISNNMKNYSSLSIGENDNLRQIYERSASRGSNRSLNMQLEQSILVGGSNNQENQNNGGSIGGLSSPRVLTAKLGTQRMYEKEAKSLKEILQNGNLTERLAQVENDNNAKIVWPSKEQNKKNKAFNKHSKLIPDSQPRKNILLNFETTQQVINPKPFLSPQNQVNTSNYLSKKQENQVKESLSIADAFSGDHFKYIHEERERSRQHVRNFIITKFHQDNPRTTATGGLSNGFLTDRSDKIKLQKSSQNHVSLQVGRDDSMERQEALQFHGNFLKEQIDQKHQKTLNESQRQMDEGKQQQIQLQKFNQWRDTEEKRKKQFDQQDIALGLEKILREKRNESESRKLQNQRDQENIKNAVQRDQILKLREENGKKEQVGILKSDLQNQMKSQYDKKVDDMSENGMVFKVRIMNSAQPFKKMPK
eukprot:403358544